MYWDDMKSGLKKRGCNEHLLIDIQGGHKPLNKKYRDNMNCKTTDNRKEQGTIRRTKQIILFSYYILTQ
jgi:hypothetical protein